MTDTVTSLTMEQNSSYGAQVNLNSGDPHVEPTGNLTHNAVANSLYNFFSLPATIAGGTLGPGQRRARPSPSLRRADYPANNLADLCQHHQH